MAGTRFSRGEQGRGARCRAEQLDDDQTFEEDGSLFDAT